MKVKNKWIQKILIVLCLEVILFNMTSYRTFLGKYEKKEFSKSDFELLYIENGKAHIQIKNIDMPVATLTLTLKNAEKTYTYAYQYTDETTSGYMQMPEKVYIPDKDRTHTITCFLSGKVAAVILDIDEEVWEKDFIETVTVNKPVPFEWNWIRMFVVFFIFVMIDAFRHAPILQATYDAKNFKQEVVLIIVLGIFMIALTALNAYAMGDEKEDIYNKELVEAFANGSLSLLTKPSDEFLSVENPYDPLDRLNYSIERGEDYFWDSAYYQGNFYVYFGVLPVLTIFLPYFLLTGKFLNCTYVCYFICMAILILLKEILCKIYKNYFQEIPFKLVVFSLITLYAGCLIFYINGCVRFYEVAIVSGVYCVLQSIFFILKAIENKEKQYRFIFLSCLFMALSVACRPIHIISSIILLPYLLKVLVENIKNNKQNKIPIIQWMISVVIPYMVVAIPLMWYNYARFGSILEFGTKYQLTVNNMLTLRSRIFTIPVGLLCNLFSVPKFIPDFPFVINHNDLAVFYGYYYIENMIGGVFMLAPICFACFYIFKIRKKLQNKSYQTWLYVFLITAILMASVSAAMAGSIQRYLFDYAWMFVLDGILIFCSMYQLLQTQEAKKIFMKIMCVLTIYTVVVGICAGIVSEKSYFQRFSPEVYYKMKYTICFWE